MYQVSLHAVLFGEIIKKGFKLCENGFFRSICDDYSS